MSPDERCGLPANHADILRRNLAALAADNERLIAALARRDVLDQAVLDQAGPLAEAITAWENGGSDGWQSWHRMRAAQDEFVAVVARRAGQDQPTTSQPECTCPPDPLGDAAPHFYGCPATQEADQPCPRCEGSGLLTVGLPGCPDCGGRGRVGGTTQEANDG